MLFRSAITYSLNSGNCSVSGNSITANADSGTCSVTATIAADASYNSASTTATYTLSPALLMQTITFTQPSTMTSTDAGQNLTYSASSGLTVTLTVNSSSICRISSGRVIPSAPGTCSITASQGGNSTYAAAVDVTRTFTINGLAQTVTFRKPNNMVTTDNPQSLVATATSGLTVLFQMNDAGTIGAFVSGDSSRVKIGRAHV